MDESLTHECPDEVLRHFILLNYLFMSASAQPAAALLQGMSAGEILDRIRAENWLGRAAQLAAMERDFDSAAELGKCRDRGVKLIPLADPAYPALLSQIHDPPLLLYVKGDLSSRDSNALAVVGSRNATFYGLTQARRFSFDLASAGFTIVSGMALGIDRAAHEGALNMTGGRTLAVLGCGIDVVYPEKNRDLGERITPRGALITEFPLGTRPLAHHFPLRNRIISGLSLGVLVVEAHSRSGSLITASSALEQGREVFAVPGRIDQLTSRGTHSLIKEGAFLSDSPQDIIQFMASQLSLQQGTSKPAEDPPQDTASGERGTPADPISAALASGAETYDEILQLTGLPPAALLAELGLREIRGWIQRSVQGRYSVCR